MSQIPNQYSSNYDAGLSENPGRGLAIASLVLGIVGLLPLIGPVIALVGLILGIVAITKAPEGQKGLAVAGTTVSGVAIFLSCVISIGILLPALGKARNTARQVV